MAYIGKPIPGKLDALLVAGKGQYTADVSLPEMGFMAVLRSPVAHAHIASINVEAARRLPGVRLVVTGKEIQGCTNPISHTIDPRAFGGNSIDIYCLAIDRVRYVGEPVAAVVADDRYLAAEALDLIQVEYDDLPPVVDPQKALEPDSPLLYPEWKTNRMLHVHFHGGDVQAAFARAAYTFTDTVHIRRHTGNPIEPRAYVAALDPAQGLLTLWASTQTPQCGYCTPGMVLSAYQLLQEHPHPDEDTIRHGIAGNLCRCTGYQNIIKAIEAVAAATK